MTSIRLPATLARTAVAGIVFTLWMTAQAAAAPSFVLSYLSGTSAQAQAAFQDATNFWSSQFTDSVTVNLTVGTGSLGAGILASTASANVTTSYSAYRSRMIADATSATDTAALAHLPNTAGVPIYMNYTSDNPNGSGSATPYLDTSGGNNSIIYMTTANARALGLSAASQAVTGCLTACDGFVELNTGFSYDFDRSNGITAGTYDLTGLAIHEIGHALGFVSGVDILDTNSTSSFFTANQFTFVTPLDMFRCSAASAAAGAALDFTAGNATKYTSLDNCATTLGQMATGQVHGDGRQASHWKDNLGLGVMDPTAATGELLTVTSLDLTAFDLIGWSLAEPSSIPEPGTWILAIGLPALFAVSRRRHR